MYDHVNTSSHGRTHARTHVRPGARSFYCEWRRAGMMMHDSVSRSAAASCAQRRSSVVTRPRHRKPADADAMCDADTLTSRSQIDCLSARRQRAIRTDGTSSFIPTHTSSRPVHDGYSCGSCIHWTLNRSDMRFINGHVDDWIQACSTLFAAQCSRSIRYIKIFFSRAILQFSLVWCFLQVNQSIQKKKRDFLTVIGIYLFLYYYWIHV